jgi:hypothetical protein
MVSIAVSVVRPPSTNVTFSSTQFAAQVNASAGAGSLIPVFLPSGVASSLAPIIAFPSNVSYPILEFTSTTPGCPLIVNVTTYNLILESSLPSNTSFCGVHITVRLFGFPEMTAGAFVAITVINRPIVFAGFSSLSFAFNAERFALASTQIGVLTLAGPIPEGFTFVVDNSPLFFAHVDTGAIVLRATLNATVGTVFDFNATVSNGAVSATAGVRVTVVPESSCVNVNCTLPCYLNPTCRNGVCFYSGTVNSVACNERARCSCAAETAAEMTWCV